MGADQVYLCPKCKSEDVKKVSLVYETGVQDTNTKTLGGGILVDESGIQGVGGGIASSRGTTRSLLAERIAPPDKPKRGYIIGCVGSVGIMFAYASLAERIGITRGLVIFIVGLVIIFLVAYAVHKKESREYDEALRQWNLDWVCNRCGNVFIIEDKT